MRKRLNEWLPDWLTVGYLLLYVRTDRFTAAVDRIARYRRVWTVWHSLGIVVTGALFVIMTILTAIGTYTTASDPPAPSPVNDPANVVAVPGVNDAFPVGIWPSFLVAIAVVIVVHEVGHAIAAAVAGIGREDMGLVLLGPLPVGAFVELKQDDLAAASVWDRLRVACAGILNNVAVAVVTFPLLLSRPTGVWALVDAYRTAIVSGGADVAGVLAIDPVTNAIWLTWFLSLNVAAVNAVPALPLDGGHVLRAVVGVVVERLRVDRETVVSAGGRDVPVATRGVVSVAVSLVVFAAWGVLLFGPHFL